MRMSACVRVETVSVSEVVHNLVTSEQSQTKPQRRTQKQNVYPFLLLRAFGLGLVIAFLKGGQEVLGTKLGFSKRDGLFAAKTEWFSVRIVAQLELVC